MLLGRSLNADGRHDWRNEDLKGYRFKNERLEGVDFGSQTDVHFEETELVDFNFARAKLVDCHFVNCSLSKCYFSSAWLEDCTLKHSTFDRATFSSAVFLRCDLYRTVWVANNLFTNARFSLVSLSQATLSGTLGLRRSAFTRSRPPRVAAPQPAPTAQESTDAAIADALAESMEARSELPGDPLVQTNEHEYRDFLGAIPDAHMTVTKDDSIEERLTEAAGVWRNLSALWASQGASADAGWAYVNAKRLERQDASPRRWRHQARGRSRPYRYLIRVRLWVRWLLLLGAGGLCNFGNSLLLTVCWVPVFVLSWGVVYWRSGVVHSGRHPASFSKALLFSLAQVANATQTPLTIHGSTGRVLASIETLLGIALLGLVGFVLGNTIRNS
jgi:hypothetical protein